MIRRSFRFQIPLFHLDFEHFELTIDEHLDLLDVSAKVRRQLAEQAHRSDLMKERMLHQWRMSLLTIIRGILQDKPTEERRDGSDEPDPGAGGAGS